LDGKDSTGKLRIGVNLALHGPVSAVNAAAYIAPMRADGMERSRTARASRFLSFARRPFRTRICQRLDELSHVTDGHLQSVRSLACN
jgi:hypothetical protein